MRIVAITGSGISAPSGIKTYRDGTSGWDEYANGIAHAKKYGNYLPQLWQHWTQLARIMEESDPNPAHLALSAHNVNTITQNVDGLHTVAGSQDVIELHGDMRTMRCLRCKKSQSMDLSTESPVCSHCGSKRVRANIVLFGERLSKKKIDESTRLVNNADIVLIVGTSGNVYPVRDLIDVALESDTPTYLFDTVEWEHENRFTDVIIGDCAETLPGFLDGC